MTYQEELERVACKLCELERICDHEITTHAVRCQEPLKEADAILSPFKHLIELQELAKWTDAPVQAGEYWVSPFCDGNYIQPRILSVIDFQRPDRGLEVQYESPHCIPVKTFIEEYYPKAKWMFIQRPKSL